VTGESPGAPLGILIVDDHRLFRDGLREILQLADDLTVLSEAGNADSAVLAAAEYLPDVILLDIGIPGEPVLATVERITEVSPRSRVIILTMYDDPALVHNLLARGVSGYLLKTCSRQELLSAIRGSGTGEDRILVSVSRDSLVRANEVSSDLLTAREIEILELVSLAMSNAQVARRLSLTEAMVKRHMRNIFGKLGAVSRIDAVNKAISASLLPAPSSRLADLDQMTDQRQEKA
jgi:DNA-binding NarL/FixJ family response regulator